VRQKHIRVAKLTAAALIVAGTGVVAGPGSITSSAAATYVRNIGGPALSAFYSSGFDYDDNLNRYVLADTGLNRVVIYNNDGTLRSRFGQLGTGTGAFDTPRDVAVGRDSAIYVADTRNHRVQKFDSAGKFVWSTTGLLHPMGIGYDRANGQVLVAVTGHSTIAALNPSTGAVRWTSPSGTTLGIGAPRDVAAGPDGRVWVDDYKHHQIKAYDVTSGGSWTLTPKIVLGTGSPGPANGQLAFPYNMEFRRDTGTGKTFAYVSDTANASIAIWDVTAAIANPQINPVWAGRIGDDTVFEDLRRVDVKANGDVVGDDFWGNKVLTFTPAGAQIQRFPSPAESDPGPNGFAQAFGVALSPDGNTLYGIDRLNQRVVMYNTVNGNHVKTVGTRGPTAKDFSWPEEADVAPDGSVWIMDTVNDSIKKWSADLNPATVKAYPSNRSPGKALGQFETAEGIAVDKSSVYVADTGNNRIQKMNQSTGNFSLLTGTGLSRPQGVAIAAGADGNADFIFVADTRKNRVVKLNLAGEVVATSSTAMKAPEGVTVDSRDGSVWVADSQNNRVLHLSTSLALLSSDTITTFPATSGPNTLYRPHSLDQFGNRLYVADTHNHRIVTFTI
jgi:tripartite motif-containing protein 71